MRQLDRQKQRSLKAHAEEPASGRVPLSKDPLRWLYPALIAGMSIVLLDRHLAPERVESKVVEVEQFDVNTSSSRFQSTSHWVVVILEDGTRFQTKRTQYRFPDHIPLVIEKSALFGRVLRYQRPTVDTNEWALLEEEDEDFRPLPYLILAVSFLLLLPWWSLEYRYIGKGLLLVMVLSWTFILIGTGILKVLG
jgi:hypothetical protein